MKAEVCKERLTAVGGVNYCLYLFWVLAQILKWCLTMYVKYFFSLKRVKRQEATELRDVGWGMAHFDGLS